MIRTEPPGHPTTPVESCHVEADAHHPHCSRGQIKAGALSTVPGPTKGAWQPPRSVPIRDTVSLPSSLAQLATCLQWSRFPGGLEREQEDGRDRGSSLQATRDHFIPYGPQPGVLSAQACQLEVQGRSMDGLSLQGRMEKRPRSDLTL